MNEWNQIIKQWNYYILHVYIHTLFNLHYHIIWCACKIKKSHSTILWSRTYVGRGEQNQSRGHNKRLFGLSWICLVYFLYNFTEFHVIQMECQIIIFHILLIILINPRRLLSASFSHICFHSPIAIDITMLLTLWST